MRRAIYNFLDTPWGFRITCGVLFVVLMGLVRYGLHVLKSTNDDTLILGIGLPIIACVPPAMWPVHSPTRHIAAAKSSVLALSSVASEKTFGMKLGA